MSRLVTLLRGLNVGKTNRIKMDALKAVMHRLGARDVVTCIQSGNAVFDADFDPRDFDAALEAALAAEGLRATSFTRPADDVIAITEGYPFEVDDLRAEIAKSVSKFSASPSVSC
ncbi:MAG: hypothetical protein CR993_07605 [Rhodobacterales bacterium]|nr:MAG: hypothetical protein CR993_07605 [Rhodobacterales bacterium]